MVDTGTVGGGLKSLSKNQKIGIGVGAAGLLGFTLYRYQQQQKQSQAAAAAAAAAQAPGTGAGSSDQIDPATGFPYGSAEDASALTTMAGYNSPIAGLGASDTSYLYGGGQYPSGTGGIGGYTSNAAWSQAAESYLVNTTGADANTVGNALGKYITGGSVTSDQMAIINQAIAFVGYPPVAGPNGFPPSIQTAGTPASTTPPATTPPQTVIVPNCIGQGLDTAIGKCQTAGLYPHSINSASYGTPSHFKCNGQNPSAGTHVPKGTQVNLSAVHK
jgi:hypothetical protein